MSPAHVIARPRVEDRLAAALDRGPVVLAAPAGYGKTAALAAAVKRRTGPVVWHTCRARDAEPGRLLISILRELRTVVPGAADTLLEQLHGPGDAVEPEAVVDALLWELTRLLLEPLILVLDDGEQLSGDPATLAVLEALLDADPSTLRLALCTRQRPALRLARRAAAEKLTQFDEAELSFDPSECALLLANRDGRPPAPEAVRAAMAETRGWPLGLALGLGGPDARDDLLDQFLVEEVLDGLDADQRAALLDSSVEDELDAAALPAEAGRLSLQTTPGIVAWHPLVREALRVRWRIERPANERAERLAQIAERLLAAGRPADAVDRWLEASRPEAALDAMVAAAPEILRAAPGTLGGWLDALPPEIAARPDARWLEARLAAGHGRLRSAAGHYAAGRLDDTALMGIMECAYFLGDLTVAEPIRPTLEAPERLRGRPVALLASAWLGINRAAHGDIAAGVELAERAFALPGGEFAREFEPLLRVFAEVPGGGHAGLRAQLVAIEAEQPDFPEWMASIRGFVEADTGNWDGAVAHARRMVERADREDGTQYWRSLGAVQYGWSLALAGRYAEAEAVLAPLPDQGFEGWPPCWVDAGLALVAAAAGDRAGAREKAEHALRAAAYGPLFLRYLVVLCVAPVLDDERGLALLEETIRALDDALGEAGSHGLARLHAQRAELRHRRPGAASDDGWIRDVRQALSGGADVVRAEWRHLREPVWDALERGELDAEPTVALVQAAFDGDVEVLELASHPAAAVRAAAAPAVGASAHPSAPARLKALVADPDPRVAERASQAGGTRVPAPLEIRLFGGFEVKRGAWPVEWARPTAARLVRFLLVQRGAAVAQELILDALWPERPPGAAKPQLQVAVSLARQVLGSFAIVFADDAYRLALAEGVTVDTERFARAAAAVGGERRGAALAHAASLWGGTPLPEERYAPWAQHWREHLEGTYHRVLAELAGEQRAHGDELGVSDTCRRLLALDALDEGAHRMLMEAYARTGRPALALRQFLVCRRALVDGLGVEPSEATARVQAAVLEGRTP